MINPRGAMLVISTLLFGCGGAEPAHVVASSSVSSAAASPAPLHGLAGAVQVAFAAPGSSATSLFARPWPSELARLPSGRPDFRHYPGRDHFALSGFFAEAEDGVEGFSTRPAIYFSFVLPDGGGPAPIRDGDLAPALAAGAIRLLDVDPASPERGRVVAVDSHMFGAAQFVPRSTLALRPRLPLRENTLHAAVVLRSWPATPAGSGLQLATNVAFERLKSQRPLRDAHAERARLLHEPTFRWFEQQGIARDAIAAVALFRTQIASAPNRAMVEAIDALPPTKAARILGLERTHNHDEPAFIVFRGYYCTPNFQRGLEHAPFAERGGTIESDAQGRPQAVVVPASIADPERECGGQLRARFSLAVPRTPMPASGWPLMVYAHGTTGDAFSALGPRGLARLAAEAGLATVSTDQPLHGSLDPRGARPGSDRAFSIRLGPFPVPLPNHGRGGELGFYNFLRPAVLRDNIRQAVADSAALARAVLATDFAGRGADGAALIRGHWGIPAPRFNRGWGYLAAGHSQGTKTMTALAAYDPLARAGLWSAAGGDVATGALNREDSKKTLAIAQLVLGLEEGELNDMHPLSTFVQTVLDPIDPQTAGAVLRRYPARAATSILMVNGKGDSMTVHAACEALTLALDAQPLGVPAMPLRGHVPTAPTDLVAGNGPGGAATRALLYATPRSGQDGHFVAFDRPRVRAVVADYMRQLVAGTRAPRLTRPRANAGSQARVR